MVNINLIKHTPLYVGLMSGTSLDGVDAVLAEFNDTAPPLSLNIIHTYYTPFTGELQHTLKNVCFKETANIKQLGQLDTRLGVLFAESVKALLMEADICADRVAGIGCHGQTIFHSPTPPWPFSLQIGDPNHIARITGIPTVADFRRKDIAAGGQGAPLVPAFHEALFRHDTENRVILNLGGIANVTVLPGRNTDEKVQGYDTGPANALLDYWVEKHLGRRYDQSGEWGNQGKQNKNLLEFLYQDSFFRLAAPKSTGKEYFSPEWLEQKLNTFNEKVKPEDVQATLSHLTAKSVAESLKHNHFKIDRLLACGGGAHNKLLMNNLEERFHDTVVESTANHGVNPDWVEAAAFAWLAKQRLEGAPGNVPHATGALSTEVLGALYSA